MKINYICISDLHLGAEHSLLTNLDKTGEVNQSGPSKPLVAFTEALNALLENLPVDENARLVLLGDVLDMGFSDTTDVIKKFKVFAETFLSASSLKKSPKIFCSCQEIMIISFGNLSRTTTWFDK